MFSSLYFNVSELKTTEQRIFNVLNVVHSKGIKIFSTTHTNINCYF
jgi:hypothetical protein